MSQRPFPSRPPLALLAAALAVSACATAPAPAPSAGLVCGPGETPRVVAQLAFGRNIGDQPGVSEEDFARFVGDVLAPAFPSGLTVFDAQGWWREGEAHAEREAAKLVLVAGPEAAEPARLDAVRAAYRARFNQHSVLLLKQTACVAS